jgi:hypothetical protein
VAANNKDMHLRSLVAIELMIATALSSRFSQSVALKLLRCVVEGKKSRLHKMIGAETLMVPIKC